jgi:hypothetical protein
MLVAGLGALMIDTDNFEKSNRSIYVTNVGIAIPGQFPNPGILDWRGRDAGTQCTYEDL